MHEGRTLTCYTDTGENRYFYFYVRDSRLGSIYYCKPGTRVANAKKCISMNGIQGLTALEPGMGSCIGGEFGKAVDACTQKGLFFTINVQSGPIHLQALDSALDRSAFMFGIHSVLVENGYRLADGKSHHITKMDRTKLLSLAMTIVERGSNFMKYAYGSDKVEMKLFYYQHIDYGKNKTSDSKSIFTTFTFPILLGKLFWTKPGGERHNKNSYLSLMDITDLLVGKKSEVFQRKHAKGVPDEVCFSIGYNHRTLDLVAKSKFERNIWVTCLEHLLRAAGVVFKMHVDSD